MSNLIACAPCCWGVDSSDNPHNPNWMSVVSEAWLAGYVGIELGPNGFLPQDADTVNTALYFKGLEVCAATLIEPLSDPIYYESILNKSKQLCAMLEKIGCTQLVVIDVVNDVRNLSAGVSASAPRLDDAHWAQMISTIRDIASIAKNYDIRVVVKPQTASYIEFRDEIERVLADLTPADAGLCLDTGQLYYAGMDPADTLLDLADRLEYLNFSDLNEGRFNQALADQIGFRQARINGVMCPLGEGVIDYRAIADVLAKINYRGWITIEQDRDPGQSATAFMDIKKSRQLLMDTGIFV